MYGSWKQQLLQPPKQISAFSELNEIKYTTGGGEINIYLNTTADWKVDTQTDN